VIVTEYRFYFSIIQVKYRNICDVIWENMPFGETALFQISCFHTFVIIFMVETSQGAIQIFNVDVHEQQIWGF